MENGLEYTVSPRFLSESLPIEALHSVASYGLPLVPQGLSYNKNVHAGAHTHLSMYMGVPCPINGSNRSRPVRERVPRHSVSWHMTRSYGLADPLLFQHSRLDKEPSSEWISHSVFRFCLYGRHSHHSDDLGCSFEVVRVL
jgi:hypothetical protein